MEWMSLSCCVDKIVSVWMFVVDKSPSGNFLVIGCLFSCQKIVCLVNVNNLVCGEG